MTAPMNALSKTLDETAQAIAPKPEGSDAARIAEALLFAASEPLSVDEIASCLPEGTDMAGLMDELRSFYSSRGVHLVQVADKWSFRTADDLSFLLRREALEQRRLSKAALETLAIISYHQPVTRADIEDVRGVAISKGTLDALMEVGWIRMRGRRRTPGRPVTYGTSEEFLKHFGLNEIGDLPGLQELKGAGLLNSNLPPDFTLPNPESMDGLADDEDPLEDDDEMQPALEMDLPDPETEQPD